MSARRIDLRELAIRESEQVEWKENVADVDDVVAALCAFANDLANLGGGYVVCGAREGKDPHGFPMLVQTGLTAQRLKEVEGKVMARCRERVSPPISPLVDELPTADPERRILVFTMPASSAAHQFRRANEGAKHFVRISRETLEARNGTLLELLVRKGVTESWDRRPCVAATVDDIDLLALRQVLQRIGLLRDGNGSVDSYLSATLPVSAFIPPLFVAEPITGILRPRNFTILLFGSNVQRFVPGAVSFFSVYPGINRGVSRGQRTEFDGTLLGQLGTMLPLLEAQAVTLYDKDDLRQPSVRKYPERALREALVNAFAHRDYQRVEPLRVTAFIDRVEINSPGSLPLGVRIEDFRRGDVGALWRNQTLAWFLNRLGLAEGEGQGLDTIQETMLNEGCPPPEFHADEVKVVCVLRAHPRAGAAHESEDPALVPAPNRQIFSVPFRRNVFFTGREPILEMLGELFRPRSGKPWSRVVLTGLGGIGKTQVAVEFAYRHRQEYKAVFFVRASSEAEIVGGYAAIAALLQLPEAVSGDQQAALLAAKSWMETNERWLLILDDADSPSLIEDRLPSGESGHVLMTSRAQSFGAIQAQALRLTPPADEEALRFLLDRTGRKEAGEREKLAAAQLAWELGNLPLALEQAAAYLVERQASFEDYLTSYRRRGVELLERSGTPNHRDPLATTWALNFKEVEKASPASADLLRAAAFLDPEAIPDELFLEGGREISESLAAATASRDPLAVAELAVPLLRYSLIERDPGSRTLSVHPLVQEVVKLRLGSERIEIQKRLVKALRRAFPWPEFQVWPLCERLMPHLAAVGKVAEETEELGWLLDAGAVYLQARGRFAEAERWFVRALAIGEKTGHRDSARTLANLATLYVAEGRLAEAEPLYTRSLEIWQALGESDLMVGQGLHDLAVLYTAQNRPSEAEPLFLQALAMRERALGSAHPEVARGLNDLAELYRRQGRLSEAEALYLQSLDIRRKALAEKDPAIGQTLNDLGELYRNQGRYAEAESLLVRSLSIREKALGQDHPFVAQTLSNYGRVLRLLGRGDEADAVELRADEVTSRHEARNRRSATREA